MTNISRLLVTAVLAPLMLGSPSHGAQRIAHRISVYDGDWSVLIQTTRGNCLRASVLVCASSVVMCSQRIKTISSMVTSPRAVPCG